MLSSIDGFCFKLSLHCITRSDERKLDVLLASNRVFKVFNDVEVYISLVVGAQAGDQLREAAKDQ